jgi:Mg2+-importing ATPase
MTTLLEKHINAAAGSSPTAPTAPTRNERHQQNTAVQLTVRRDENSYWSTPADDVLRELGSGISGLSSEEAKERLEQFGSNHLSPAHQSSLVLLLLQFKSPITLLLAAAAALSLYLGDITDATIIFGIILVSGLLSFWQEKGAADAVKNLLALVSVKTTVVRDNQSTKVPIEEVVPGDIVLLSAGTTVPGDCLLMESKDLFANEAALTGETFPMEKRAGVVPADTPLAGRTSVLYLGTHVVSGTAKALVVLTGQDTEFGKISRRLKLRPPETEFERGVRRFGYFLLEVTLLLILAIFAANVALHRSVLESVLFSLALAVGMTPQLLPAIISVNLSHGARRMAAKEVIVRRLASIQNFGSMNVFCSDKTGTLTEGTIHVHAALDASGHDSQRVFDLAYVNASLQSGFTNPLDEAILRHKSVDLSDYEKLDEIPYDFIRKRLSVLVRHSGQSLLITKGAFHSVIDACTRAAADGSESVPLSSIRDAIEQQYTMLSSQGFRTIGVACRLLDGAVAVSKQDEAEMEFVGFLVLSDPPKPGVDETIRQLQQLGISLKIITGDNRLVAANVARQVGLSTDKLLTGSDLRQMSDAALVQRALTTQVFAEVEPNQKEQIIIALKKAGQVVGYLGDGINDATALHAADVGISVDQAVDVAKEAADIVLLKRDLSVLVAGVEEGRATFANTLKYVFMATSANFGNMFSMAGASLFLPFLPLLPKQVLLTNLLTDLPEMTIAGDRVDEELVARPRRWDVSFIRRFMLVFGPLSSIFDYLTFGVLLALPGVSRAEFRTAWFIESVVSACLVVLVIRSRRRFWKSMPSRPLLVTNLLVIVAALTLPFTPVAAFLGFASVPLPILLIIAGIIAAYVASAEWVKTVFYRRIRHDG